MTAERPPWPSLAATEAFDRLGVDFSTADPSQLAQHDRFAATVRDALDAMGMTLAEEWCVYQGFVFLSLVADAGFQGHTAQLFDDRQFAAIIYACRAIGSVLIEFVPDEAKA